MSGFAIALLLLLILALLMQIASWLARRRRFAQVKAQMEREYAEIRARIAAESARHEGGDETAP
jgi:Na+-transporting methylmalonyl-CoA/oxaloacetate decarboxylase gamma subunit